MMSNYQFGSGNLLPFNACPKSDFDLESGTIKRTRKPKKSTVHPIIMIKSIANRVHYYFKLHPFMAILISLTFGVIVFIFLSLYESHYWFISTSSSLKFDMPSDDYPFPKLKNLVMVAGHSIYTSSNCAKVDKEDSWFLESYQKNPGQAATFLTHIKEGIEIAALDDSALLLFSGGETRKDAGPRSEAQSYWAVADSKGWFGEFLHFSISDHWVNYLINCSNL